MHRAPPLLASLALLSSVARADGVPEDDRIRVARQLQTSSVAVAVGRGGGSGFVANQRGWIVTNAHVIQAARYDEVRVHFGDGSTSTAQVVAIQPEYDLAFIAPLNAHSIPPLPLADSDQVQVGQGVLAFGSPYGLEGTLTQGIVSARRDLPGINGARGLIQTDAPINPGNSGGPLVNSRGEVIGVNTAILSRTGGSHGIGFAIPSNYVRDALRELEQRATTGSAPSDRASARVSGSQGQGAWLGIYGTDFRGPGRGVQIHRVVPGSPAALASLRGSEDPPPGMVPYLGIPWTGYIITSINGEAVRGMADLERILGALSPNDKATIGLTVGPGIINGTAVVQLALVPRPSRADRARSIRNP